MPSPNVLHSSQYRYKNCGTQMGNLLSLSWPLLQGTRAAWRWWATARAPPAYTTSWPPMLSLTVSQKKYLIIKQKIFITDFCLLTWKVTSSSSAITLYCYWPSLYCFFYWLLRRSAVFTISNDIQLIYREGFLEICQYVFNILFSNDEWTVVYLHYFITQS